MRTESQRHREVIDKITKFIGGLNQDDKIRPTRSYNPDVRLGNIDIEVEIYNKKRHIFNKRNNWENSRPKVLIIALPKELEDVFDYTMLWKD
jgi:hypothetical protein